MKYFKLFLLAAFFCSGITAAAGQKSNRKLTITGIVLNQDRKPVTGAVIFIDNVKTNAVTDQNGYYRVKVSPGAGEILVFTLLNGSVEEMISGRTKIDFTLSGQVDDKPVVKRDFSDQKKVLEAQDSEFASYQSIYDMIRGRFPGVEVSGKSIKVMGSSSLNVSTEPLFVVDGIIVNSIDDIPPLSVKTIQVLKGPDATVYGTRGANGVIVITRRTGKD